MLGEIEIPLPITHLVADSIRRSIISGELTSGQKISVAEIGSLFKVSTTPVKQAFKMLQSEGLLITKPRSGTIISDFAKKSLEQTTVIRSGLEGAAAHLAALLITSEELEKLESILKRSDAAIKKNDLNSLITQNTYFHKTVREATKNSYLINLIERLISFDYSFRRSALQTLEERKLGSKEHWEVYKFIKEKNPDKAERALVEHIRRSSSVVVAKFKSMKG
jgi:DNA-binding GntR family transcriptional regulator